MAAVSDNIVGMAGQFISAVLETSGMYGQSHILQNMEPLFHSLGALIYAFCFVGALLSVAIFGNYRRGVYLLLGPALFWWVIMDRVEVTAAGFQLGARQMDDEGEEVLSFLKRSSEQNLYDNQAEVSTLFVIYDNVVSSIVQGTVSLIVDTQNQEDMLRVSRERVVSRILYARGTEKKFVRLIAISLMGKCSEAVAVKNRLSRPPLSNPEPGSLAETQRASLLALYEELKAEQVYSDDSFPIDLREYIESFEQASISNPTCEEIWWYVKDASLEAARELLQPTEQELAETPPCMDGVDSSCLTPQEYWDEVYEQVKEYLRDENTPPEKAVEALAAFLLKNSVQDTMHSVLASQMNKHANWFQHLKQNVFGNVSTATASSQRLKIVFFAGAIPYIQGLLLYILTCAFPFFAFYLLMPGRVTSFFVWASLWLWVKSWDVGFAVVSFFRELFWQMLPHPGATREAANFNVIDWNEPASIYNAVYLNDPLSHMNTYYFLIAVLTIAVPAVTAHLCLGATNLFNSMKNSIDMQANRFANENRTSKLREYATIQHSEVENERMKIRNAAVEFGAKHAGLTADDMPRGAAADGTVGAYANALKDIAGFRFNWTRDQRLRMNDRALYTGRRMDWTITSAKDPIAALTHLKNEGLLVRPFSTGTHRPIFGSDKPGIGGTSIQDIMFGGGWQEMGTDSAGPGGGEGGDGG